MLIKKEHPQFIRNVKAIPGEFQHALVIADIDRKQIRKIMKKVCAERRKTTMLKDVKTWNRFEEKVIELVDVGAQKLWGHSKNMALNACDEVCGRKMVRRQFQGRKMYTRPCVRIILRRIRGSIKA